jgi:zinc transport system ATP-binding protein
LVELTALAENPIGELSGGQLQRTLLARAIVSSPELLILDEPDSYMDKTFKSRLTEIFKNVNLQSAVIVVSHQEKDFALLAKHSLYIDRG